MALTRPSRPSDPPPPRKGLSTGAKVGIGVGVVLALGAGLAYIGAQNTQGIEQGLGT